MTSCSRTTARCSAPPRWGQPARPRRPHRHRVLHGRPGGRGRGVGPALGEYAVQWHREPGFRGIQFNAVVETNTAAVRLWQRSASRSRDRARALPLADPRVRRPARDVPAVGLTGASSGGLLRPGDLGTSAATCVAAPFRRVRATATSVREPFRGRGRACQARPNPGGRVAAGDLLPAHPGERSGDRGLLGPAPRLLGVGRRHGRPKQRDHVAARPAGSVVPVGQVEDVHRAHRRPGTPADRLPGILRRLCQSRSRARWTGCDRTAAGPPPAWTTAPTRQAPVTGWSAARRTSCAVTAGSRRPRPQRTRRPGPSRGRRSRLPAPAGRGRRAGLSPESTAHRPAEVAAARLVVRDAREPRLHCAPLLGEDKQQIDHSFTGDVQAGVMSRARLGFDVETVARPPGGPARVSVSARSGSGWRRAAATRERADTSAPSGRSDRRDSRRDRRTLSGRRLERA